MENDINSIISASLLVDKSKLKDMNNLVDNIKKTIMNIKDLLKEANEIDKKNSNGFIMDYDVINNIFNNTNGPYYGDVILSQKDDKKKLIYGKQIMDAGNVTLIYDGNPYVTLEMIIRNIMVGNTLILVNDGYMYGTNQLIVSTIKKVISDSGLDENILGIYITEDYESVLKNYANIDLVVCIGNHDLQSTVLKLSNNKTIVSGYENFDIYIEDDKNMDFINKIINTNLNINIYVNNNLNLDINNSIEVSDIEEAISQINYNCPRYSSSIFTSNQDNASKFIREVKSKIITVNTSPSIERIMDIDDPDLYNEKTIIYPLSFKFNDSTKIVNDKNLNK